ncbi:MAG TPA: ATP synthase F1 subunit delta [Acidimicrobiales bacterium]|nr:ATP synthase F1 subunit delta [Acidimicrobiales bacterium]
MHQSLRGYTTALLADVARDAVGEQIADDINAVAHLVSRTNDLALVLTDFTVSTAARKAVLEDLLTSRVHPLALKIVLRIVETGRVEEFPTALHELYELARHMHDLDPEEFRAEEPIVSRTAWRDYVAGYSEAVFEEVTETTELHEIEDELFRFARVVESSPSLRSVLSDTTLPLANREQILNDLLDGKVRPATLRLVRTTIAGRVRDLASSLDWLVEQAARARGWRVARVYTGLPIDAEEQGVLAEALERIARHPVELQVMAAPDILGGAVIHIGDLLVDASAQRRLDQVEEHLLSLEGATRGAQT